MRLYSQFTLAELQVEMETLRKQIDEKKRQNDQVSVGILEQKFFMAKSYYVGTQEFRIGKCYKVHGQQEPFIIEYLMVSLHGEPFNITEKQKLLVFQSVC
ncbi:DUF1811 family protein [Brevibacillus laterosporus]|uniref:DUF1811 family protein n=1 Tax=Brevibacillus laterosporus TaxID=1465 RepID=UPI002E246E95